jgi:preprotein translocase subunit YajC
LTYIWQQGDGAVSPLFSALPFLLIFGIFYFLLFLPTQKRQKKQREMLSNLKAGDRVVTTGGIRGTIDKIKDDALYLRVAPQDVRLEIVRNAVATVEAEKN